VDREFFGPLRGRWALPVDAVHEANPDCQPRSTYAGMGIAAAAPVAVAAGSRTRYPEADEFSEYCKKVAMEAAMEQFGLKPKGCV